MKRLILFTCFICMVLPAFTVAEPIVLEPIKIKYKPEVSSVDLNEVQKVVNRIMEGKKRYPSLIPHIEIGGFFSNSGIGVYLPVRKTDLLFENSLMDPIVIGFKNK